MSVKKFKFVSPGIFLNEIDNSQLPSLPGDVGPLVIGRTVKGPAFRPVKVNSFSEFVEIFGNPQNGGGAKDSWRSAGGSATAPTYAAYAAQAWLANNSPLTVVRVLGRAHTDTTAAGKAGWWTYSDAGYDTEGTVSTTSGEGAYGLFVCPSGSAGQYATGSLAAIFYTVNGASIRLSGTLAASASLGTPTTGATNALVESNGPDSQFTVQVLNDGASVSETLTFNFARNSKKFIRRVANSNATFVNTNITQTAQQKRYFLGETFETAVASITNENGTGGLGGAAGSVRAFITGLESDSGSVHWGNNRMDLRASATPWLFAQNLGDTGSYDASAQTKLFKVVAQEGGQYDMHSMKVSIKDIKAGTGDLDPYGSFTLVIRSIKDTDKKQQVLETFSNLNLNPNSKDYISKRIGDKYVDFDSVSRRTKERGKYDNQSRFVRVEMNEDLDAGGLSPELLPWGFHHPAVPLRFSMVSGSTVALKADGSSTLDYELVQKGYHAASGSLAGQQAGDTLILEWPTLRFRHSGSDGGITFNDQAYFGFDSGQSATNATFDESILDIVRPLPADIVGQQESEGNSTFHPKYFTMDDLVGAKSSSDIASNLSQHAFHRSGSLIDGTSIAANSSSADPDGYKRVLDAGFDKFTVPLVGGFDGLNIYEKEPIINNQTRATCLNVATTPREINSYSHNSVLEAIDMVSDVDDLEFNILTAPGVTQTALTDKVIDICEERGDALGIIDIENVFTPQHESTDSYTTRLGSVKDAVSNLKDRQINSSYGATYYPWTQIKDSINGNLLYSPPSVIALGAMGSSEAASELWFAPAGFNRGGLSTGKAGLAVTNVTEKVNSKDRDKLYEANINPIASFPNEGIVIFGQKTLQIEQSALDRINVRRLMIHVKKEISRMATKVLFDPNVQVTWNRFLSMVEPFLRSVKTRLGLTDFKVVLDDTTTTADLVDRNVMYAKIFLKPARAIEYIAIDFNITSTGAGFED